MFAKEFEVKNLQKVVYFRKLIIFGVQLQFFFWLIALSILKNKASWTNTRHILVFSYSLLNVKNIA